MLSTERSVQQMLSLGKIIIIIIIATIIIIIPICSFLKSEFFSVFRQAVAAASEMGLSEACHDLVNLTRGV